MASDHLPLPLLMLLPPVIILLLSPSTWLILPLILSTNEHLRKEIDTKNITYAIKIHLLACHSLDKEGDQLVLLF